MQLSSQSTFLVLALASQALVGCAPTTANVAGGDTSSQGTMVASTRASSSYRSAPALEAAGDAEGILCRNGRLFYVKDHGTSLLTGKQRVTNELFLENAKGDVLLSDGRRIRVSEGYMVTTSGELIEAPSYLR